MGNTPRFDSSMTNDALHLPDNRVIAHVGAHKTGTSLVQKFLRDRPEQLAAESICYISRSDMNDYIGWGNQLLDAPEHFRARILREMRETPGATVVFSHENSLGRPLVPGDHDLYPNAAGPAKALRRVLDGLNYLVVFYLRPIPAFVESYYLQTIHQGAYHTFAEWISRYPIDSMSWRPVVETLYDVFGEARVRIGDFEEIKTGQSEFLERFLTRSGLEGRIEVDYVARRNLSISGRGLELALRINPYLRTYRERRQTRKYLQKHYNNADFPRPVLFTADQRTRLEGLFAQEYAELVGSNPA